MASPAEDFMTPSSPPGVAPRNRVLPAAWRITAPRADVCHASAAALAARRSVGRQGRQTRVVDRAAGGEVIERLPRTVAGQAERAMQRVVEEAADTGRTDARGLGLEVEHLPDRPAFPVQLAIAPKPADGEVGEHRERIA